MSGDPLSAAAPFGLPGIDFADLADAIAEGLWAVDRDGVTVWVNPRMATITGRTPLEMIGHPLLEFFDEGDRPLVRENWRRRIQGHTDSYEAGLIHINGSIVHCRLHAVPLLYNGEVVGSVAAVTDITDLRRVDDERDAALREAQEAHEASSKFLSWVSHELRTPLNTISGFAQLLQAQLQNESNRAMATNILAATNHVTSLVQDLLDYSRAEANALVPAVVPVPLRDALEEAMSLVAGTAREHEVTIAAEVADDAVLADRRHLVQILTNLISNAVKYGGRGSTVTISSTAGDGRVRCSVTDQGPGISPHQQLTVFRPFQRLDNAAGVSGVGLGLAIAEAYTRAMKGTITIESEPGHGATFIVDLPAAIAPTADEADRDPTAEIPSVATVLYVEDEPLNAALVTSIVALLSGRTIQVESTVAAGLAATKAVRPALILLDVNLPDGSGFDVLKAVRDDPALRATPVFMLSADATEQATRRATEMGADRFITKPFDLTDFLHLIDEATRPTS